MVLHMKAPVKPLSSLASIANKAILEVVLDPPVGAETSLNLGNLSLIASSDALLDWYQPFSQNLWIL